jgi:hypothetical protein
MAAGDLDSETRSRRDTAGGLRDGWRTLCRGRRLAEVSGNAESISTLKSKKQKSRVVS